MYKKMITLFLSIAILLFSLPDISLEYVFADSNIQDMTTSLGNSVIFPGSISNAAENQTTQLNGAAISASDFLKTNGIFIRNNNGNGAVVNLRGTNFGGWLLQEPWMSPCGLVDEWNLRETLTKRFGEAAKESLIDTYQKAWLQTSDLDLIKNMGMNFVRVPILYLELMDKYGNWKSDPWSKLDGLVSHCASRGIYVLLDLHGTFGGQNTFDNCGEANSDPQLWKNTQYQDRTVNLWKGIAEHFKGNPTVAGYDLLNEPAWVSKEQLNAFYDRLYKAIRAVDPDHTIYMEAAWDWSQLYPPSQFGWTNVVYELHYYAMGDGQPNSWDAQNALIEGSLQGIREHQQSWNVPIYAGEFCVFSFNDLWQKYLRGFNDLNVSWTTWTYKVTSGGNWGYYVENSNAVPDINNDSADTIRSKWQKFSTDYFKPNTAFQDAVTQCTNRASIIHDIPGKIEAEGYASMSGIKTEACAEGGSSVGYMDAKDWISYNVDVKTAGTYKVEYRVASKDGGGVISLEQNEGKKILGTMNVPSTGDWQNWTTVSHTVTLEAGKQSVAIGVPAGGYNLNWINFVPTTQPTSTPIPTPTATPNPILTPTATPTHNGGYDFIVDTTFSPTKLVANQMMTAKVVATNVSAAPYEGKYDVLLIVALYDRNNTMVNVSYISKGIPYHGAETLSAGFKLPTNITGYSVKAFMWDGQDLKNTNMLPLSNVIQIP